MNLKGIAVVVLISTLVLSSGCPVFNDRRREEAERAADAVGRMGGGGYSLTVVHEGYGKAHNRIEINFRSRREIDDNMLKNLAGLDGVVGIDLSGTAVSDSGVEVLMSLPDLEYLQLGDTAISDSGLALLAKCRNLRRLDIRRTKITAKATEILKEFPKLEVAFVKGTVLEPSKKIDTTSEVGPFFDIRAN